MEHYFGRFCLNLASFAHFSLAFARTVFVAFCVFGGRRLILEMTKHLKPVPQHHTSHKDKHNATTLRLRPQCTASLAFDRMRERRKEKGRDKPRALHAASSGRRRLGASSVDVSFFSCLLELEMTNIITEDYATSLLFAHGAHPSLSIGGEKGGHRGDGTQGRAPSACAVRPHAHRTGEGSLASVRRHFSLGVSIPGTTSSDAHPGLSSPSPLASRPTTLPPDADCKY